MTTFFTRLSLRSARGWLWLAPMLALGGSCLITATPRPAEGCAGSSPNCDAVPGWRTFELAVEGPSPTDAVLLRASSSPFVCPSRPPIENMRIRAVVQGGGPEIKGTLREIEQETKENKAETSHTLLWTPETPLQPSGTYTLLIEATRAQHSGGGGGSAGAAGHTSAGSAGLGGSTGAAGLGGAGGSAGSPDQGAEVHTKLTISTADGPVGPTLAPTITTSAVARSFPVTVCCRLLLGCGLESKDCVAATDRDELVFGLALTATVPPASLPFFNYTVSLDNGQPLLEDGPWKGSSGRSEFNSITRFLDGSSRCAVVVTENLLTGEKVTTEVNCTQSVALDPAVPHCAELSQLISSCPENRRLDSEATGLFQKYCSSQGGGEMSAPSDREASDDGCQIRQGPPAGPTGLALALALGGLSALLRRARRSAR